MCSPPAQCCELSAQCSSSLLNSLEDEEQLGSALSEGKTHGGYLKWLFYHSLRGCCEACHGLPGPAPTFSCHSLLASICMHTFSLQNCVSKITLSLMTVISFSNLLQVAELNNRSGELEDSLERISTGNFWTPHSTNTRAHSRAHTHMCIQYLWLCFHLCWHGWEFTTASKKLQAVPQKFHILLSCIIIAQLSGSQTLCQPCKWFTATSVRIFEERRKLMSTFNASVSKKLMVAVWIHKQKTQK